MPRTNLNGWFVFRVSALSLVVVIAAVQALFLAYPTESPPPPVSLLPLVFAVIVPFSLGGRALFFKEMWHLPSWSAPLKYNEPLTSFDFGAWFFLAGGIGLLPILLHHRDLWWMPVFAY